MYQTPRIRVLSNRIPRVLVFVYFYRGLSENMERRPTRQVNNKIITCYAIFLNLEESRSLESEREARRAQEQGDRPTPLGARPPVVANEAPSPGSCPTASNLQE